MTAGYLPPTVKVPVASMGRIVTALLVGAIWTAFGYFLAWWFVLDSITVAFGNIQFSLMTSAAGFVVAMILAPKLQKYFRKG